MKNLKSILNLYLIAIFVTSVFLVSGGCKGDLPTEGSKPDETPPEALFSYTQSKINPLGLKFTNKSISATDFKWDFGDGNTSEKEDPEHVYATEGTYTVSLTASDKLGADSTYKQDIKLTKSENNGPVILKSGFEGEQNTIEDPRDPWKNPDLGGELQITTGPVYEGDQAGKLPTSNDRVGYQEITVDANTDYTLSFHYTMKESPEGHLTVSILDGPVDNPSDIDDATITSSDYSDQSDQDQYVSASLSFNSGSSSTIVIYLTNKDVETRVDEFSIKKQEKFTPKITQPSFEGKEDSKNDTRDRWKNDDLGGIMQISTSPVYKGEQSCKLPASGERIAYQEIIVKPNTDYTVSFHYTLDESPEGHATVSVLDGPVSDPASVEDATIFTKDYSDQNDKSEWKFESFSFNSGSSSKIALYLTNKGTSARFDAFKIN